MKETGDICGSFTLHEQYTVVAIIFPNLQTWFSFLSHIVSSISVDSAGPTNMSEDLLIRSFNYTLDGLV